MRRMDRGLVEHLDETAMNLCLYGFLCIFGIQYMYGKSSSSSLVSIPNEVRTDLWLSSTSDAEKSVRLYVGFKKRKNLYSNIIQILIELVIDILLSSGR